MEQRRTAEQLKEYYGKDFVDWYAKTHTPRRLERLVKYMDLRSDHRVVDLACGNGLLMPLVAPKVASYLGVDFSEPFIEKANQKKEELHIQNAEFKRAEIVPFCASHPEQFDRAFSMDFSEHVYDDQWLEMLRSIRSSLKNDGVLYLHTPNAVYFLEQMKARSILVPQIGWHIAVRSADENARLLTEAGFTVRRIRFLPHYNIMKLLHFLSYIPVVGKYFQARLFIEAVK